MATKERVTTQTSVNAPETVVSPQISAKEFSSTQVVVFCGFTKFNPYGLYTGLNTKGCTMSEGKMVTDKNMNLPRRMTVCDSCKSALSTTTDDKGNPISRFWIPEKEGNEWRIALAENILRSIELKEREVKREEGAGGVPEQLRIELAKLKQNLITDVDIRRGLLLIAKREKQEQWRLEEQRRIKEERQLKEQRIAVEQENRLRAKLVGMEVHAVLKVHGIINLGVVEQRIIGALPSTAEDAIDINEWAKRVYGKEIDSGEDTLETAKHKLCTAKYNLNHKFGEKAKLGGLSIENAVLRKRGINKGRYWLSINVNDQAVQKQLTEILAGKGWGRWDVGKDIVVYQTPSKEVE